MIMIIYGLKVSGFCFILQCKAEPLEAMVQVIYLFFLLISSGVRAIPTNPGTKKNTKKQILALKCLISDYFINLQDFPWNDDAVEREWVCSKVKQSYCDKEC